MESAGGMPEDRAGGPTVRRSTAQRRGFLLLVGALGEEALGEIEPRLHLGEAPLQVLDHLIARLELRLDLALSPAAAESAAVPRFATPGSQNEPPDRPDENHDDGEGHPAGPCRKAQDH